MITASAVNFAKRFGFYRDAVQREPIAVTSHARITGYFISPERYQEYVKLKNEKIALARGSVPHNLDHLLPQEPPGRLMSLLDEMEKLVF